MTRSRRWRIKRRGKRHRERQRSSIKILEISKKKGIALKLNKRGMDAGKDNPAKDEKADSKNEGKGSAALLDTKRHLTVGNKTDEKKANTQRKIPWQGPNYAFIQDRKPLESLNEKGEGLHKKSEGALT